MLVVGEIAGGWIKLLKSMFFFKVFFIILSFFCATIDCKSIVNNQSNVNVLHPPSLAITLAPAAVHSDFIWSVH